MSKKRQHDKVREYEPTSNRRNADDSSTSEPQGGDILKLDLGGERTVKTLRSTLTLAIGSKLAAMFSGRNDESLPKSKDGSFFIDRTPELFQPLLDFLRDLSSMVPEDATNPLPPMTPSFKDPKDEASFRRMVDSYNLTNVLYNYEIYEFPAAFVDCNKRALLSRDCSIFDCLLMSEHAKDDADEGDGNEDAKDDADGEGDDGNEDGEDEF